MCTCVYVYLCVSYEGIGIVFWLLFRVFFGLVSGVVVYFYRLFDVFFLMRFVYSVVLWSFLGVLLFFYFVLVGKFKIVGERVRWGIIRGIKDFYYYFFYFGIVFGRFLLWFIFKGCLLRFGGVFEKFCVLSFLCG